MKPLFSTEMLLRGEVTPANGTQGRLDHAEAVQAASVWG